MKIPKMINFRSKILKRNKGCPLTLIKGKPNITLSWNIVNHTRRLCHFPVGFCGKNQFRLPVVLSTAAKLSRNDSSKSGCVSRGFMVENVKVEWGVSMSEYNQHADVQCYFKATVLSVFAVVSV